jgi:hypothetical protein
MNPSAGTMFHHRQGVVPMRHFVLPIVLSVAVLAASTGVCQAAGGPLARLNKSVVPTAPGLPTASPLGLIAPRMSNAVTIFQKGGFSTQAGRLAGIGVLSPRISPVVALFTTPPKTPKAMWTYGLTILSPRAAVAVGMIRGAMGMTAGLR